MATEEQAVLFDCAGDRLVGVATLAQTPVETGVLLLVGGRQYRAGSHRQLVSLARRLASADFSSFRFDFRGMGDSTGRWRSFESVDEDIDAALTVFLRLCPTVRRVVLWGLCDAATAAILYAQRRRDSRIGGLCLVNPWMRSEVGLARTQVRYYYPRRVTDPQFWRKLFSGGVNPLRTAKEYWQQWRLSRISSGKEGFQQVVQTALQETEQPVLLLLSGNDLTAKEFVDSLGEVWANILSRPNVCRHDIEQADHTFSRQSWQREAEEMTCQWIKRANDPVGVIQQPGN